MDGLRRFILVLLTTYSGWSSACIGSESGFDIAAPESDKGFFPVILGYGSVTFFTKDRNGQRLENTVSCSADGSKNLTLSSPLGTHVRSAVGRSVGDYEYLRSSSGVTVGNIHVSDITATRLPTDPVVTRTVTIDSPDRPGNRLVMNCVQKRGSGASLSLEVQDSATRNFFRIKSHSIPTARPKGGIGGSKVEPTLISQSGEYEASFGCGTELRGGSRGGLPGQGGAGREGVRP